MTLSIDDFGTGFSSLATLYRLPFGELKIDKCFTLELDRKPAARALIESTVEMAQRLGLKVTAEGVETDWVFDQLRLMGCHDAQGYFISKSLPAADIPAFFAEWRRSRGTGGGGRPGFVLKLAAIQALLDSAGAPRTDRTVVLSSTQYPSEGSALDLVAAIAPLVLQGRNFRALAACQRAAHLLKSRPDQAALGTQVLELQRLLEFELLQKNDLAISGAARNYRLLPRRSVLIGRSSTGKSVDIAIDCRWLSRGERNLFLYLDGENWRIEDLGSTNGSAVGEKTLLPGHPVVLPEGMTLVEIGRRNNRHAPLSLCLNSFEAGGVAISLTVLAKGETDAATWPTREQDLQSAWILFRGKLSVGHDDECAIKLAGRGAGVLADIEFQNGFWIAPRAGVELSLGGVSFEHPVPLTGGTDLLLGDNMLRIESALPGGTGMNESYKSEGEAVALRSAGMRG